MMPTFQGFNITGVDRDKCLVFEEGKIGYNKIYLVLEPIDGCADVENQKIWEHSFRYTFENWEQLPELRNYKVTSEKVPDLRFVLEDYDKTFISAEGPPFVVLLDSVSFIQKLVKFANKRCIYQIEEIERHRQDIDAFNSGHFGD